MLVFSSCEGPSQEVKEDILFHVSNIFDPQHMFHIFLKEASNITPDRRYPHQSFNSLIALFSLTASIFLPRILDVV